MFSPTNRSFIDRMKSDPRFRDMVRGWEHQAVVATEQRFRVYACDREIMHETAAAAIRLALEFLLESDGEYKAVCAERDAILKASMDLIQLSPKPMMYQTTKPKTKGGER